MASAASFGLPFAFYFNLSYALPLEAWRPDLFLQFIHSFIFPCGFFFSIKGAACERQVFSSQHLSSAVLLWLSALWEWYCQHCAGRRTKLCRKRVGFSNNIFAICYKCCWRPPLHVSLISGKCCAGVVCCKKKNYPSRCSKAALFSVLNICI